MARRHFASLLGCCLFLLSSYPAVAQAADAVVRIEEDWELVVGDPDPNVVGPQVTCVMAPIGSAESLHAIFNLNHQTFDNFVPGGVQLQLWHCETPITDRTHPNMALLSEPGEVVRWTQEMSIHDGQVRFSLKNGTSNTWGNFGGQGYLTSTVSTDLANLNNYDPAVSVKNSGVVFAANRVQSLVLKKIRVHTASGGVTTFVLNQSATD